MTSTTVPFPPTAVSSYGSSTNTKTKSLTRRAIHHLAGAALDLSVDAAGALAEEAVAAALVALLTAARDVRDAVCPPAGLLLFYARHVKEGGQGEGAPNEARRNRKIKQRCAAWLKNDRQAGTYSRITCTYLAPPPPYLAPPLPLLRRSTASYPSTAPVVSWKFLNHWW